ncbi:hypothetical protein V3481_012121 [Fusarium oxysporum f. sp. vasinfectum]
MHCYGATRSGKSATAALNRGLCGFRYRELNLEPAATRATRADFIAVFTQLLHTIPGCTFVADGLDECTYLDNSSTSVKKFLHDVTNAVVGTHARDDRLSLKRRPRVFPYKIMPEDVRSNTAVFSRDIVRRQPIHYHPNGENAM